MIRDKNILIKNIYYMLSYAFTSLKQSHFESLASEEFDNIHNLFGAILARGLGQQLKRGLYREYLNRKEDLTVMRGKIDMYGTLRSKIARKQTLACEYHELSEDNVFNQILKTTAMLLVRHGEVDGEHKKDLRKKMLYFSHVGMLDPGAIPWSSLRFQRNNQTYRMLLGLCQLVLQGLLLTTDAGEYRLASFLDEQRMSQLYEKFLLEYYIKKFPMLHVRASQIPWVLDDGMRAMLPVMQSDITLSHGAKVLIVDAKYYAHTTQVRYDVHTVHSNNLYQIFTYVKNKDAALKDQPHEVSGMLLYARTDEVLQPDTSYQMSGNRISVKTLDLNCVFAKIAAQLDVIVEEHFGITGETVQAG